MDIGEAISVMRSGERVCRKGWNGTGIFIEMQIPNELSKMTQPYIFINTCGLESSSPNAARGIVPWLASQTDLLAVDWVVSPNYDDVPF